MDYVDAVLFQLRWETIADRDGYFMGLYDKPYSSDDASDEAECDTEIRVCDCGTQTPKSWVVSVAAQEPKEGAPGRAQPLERAVLIGS